MLKQRAPVFFPGGLGRIVVPSRSTTGFTTLTRDAWPAVFLGGVRAVGACFFPFAAAPTSGPPTAAPLRFGPTFRFLVGVGPLRAMAAAETRNGQEGFNMQTVI